jgi:hypothetical protein
MKNGRYKTQINLIINSPSWIFHSPIQYLIAIGYRATVILSPDIDIDIHIVYNLRFVVMKFNMDNLNTYDDNIKMYVKQFQKLFYIHFNIVIICI